MRILLVEDEVGLAEAVGAILKAQGYTADLAFDGEQGLKKALAADYDCIILDIMLPKMNGLDVLSYLRVREIETPVLLLTAKSELDDKISGLDCGADDYLTKPFETGELLASGKRFGDIILDIKKGELTCGANSVILGRKEVQMLELMISNAGGLVTKEMFVKNVWGYDDDSEYNNVEVYISFLRKKLAILHSKVNIKTRRGIGYCLEDGGSL